MKGVRFYADIEGTQNEEGVAFVPKRITIRELREWAEPGDNYTPVNCIAVSTENRCPDGSFEAIAAIHPWQNSAVATTSVSGHVLAKSCRRIPEALARKLHPQLAARLDAE
jgi:hypothetical protein